MKWPARVWDKTSKVNSEGRSLYTSRDVTTEDRYRRMQVEIDLFKQPIVIDRKVKDKDED